MYRQVARLAKLVQRGRMSEGKLRIESYASCFTSRCMLSELARCRLEHFPHGSAAEMIIFVVEVGVSQNRSRYVVHLLLVPALSDY